MINTPETKWTAYSIEGSFYTNTNRSTRNIVAKKTILRVEEEVRINRKVFDALCFAQTPSICLKA